MQPSASRSKLAAAHASEGSDAEDAALTSSDIPPSYETATMDNEEQSSYGKHKPFISYSDEKHDPSQAGQASPSSNQPSLSAPASQSGESSRSPRQGGAAWSSSANRVCSIAPSMNPGNAVLRTRCFHHKSHLRLALATNSLFQVYDALRDSLLWELHGNSSQLIQGNEAPFDFGDGFRPSPDGSILVITVHRKGQRRLLIADTETGWIKSEHSMSASDGNKPHISPDNNKVMIAHWGPANDRGSHLKIFPIDKEQGQYQVRQVPFERPANWQAIGMRFAPDSRHIITCVGPAKKTKETALTVSVCVYSEDNSQAVRSTKIPCSPKFNTTSNPVKFVADFHFPSADEWLVSFPDYSNTGKTCIFNARLGQMVAVFTSELSLAQKWQVGVLSPGRAEVAYDKESGVFTKMELSATMIPRAQTATITKFVLSANGGRERSVVRKPFQIRAMVTSCRFTDACGLAPDGSHMFVQQQGSGGKIDIISLAI